MRLRIQASGEPSRSFTALGRLPETRSASVTSSSTERRLARTAIQTSESAAAAPGWLTCSDELAVLGGDLLANHHLGPRCFGAHSQAAVDAVVIGHEDRPQAQAPASLRDLDRIRAAVEGGGGVEVQIDADQYRRRSSSRFVTFNGQP